MPVNNIFQQNITPDKPRFLNQERVFVYVPLATNDSPGIASYVEKDFVVNNGVVQLTWPMDEQITELSDPLSMISRVKLLDDEFEHTNETAEVTNALGTTYKSDTAEVKFNRKHRNAFNRPELVQITEDDFVSEEDPETQYVKYTIRQNDPFEKPSLVQLDRKDFKGSGEHNNLITIQWPYAHQLRQDSSSTNTNGFGLVKISEDASEKGYLTYTSAGKIVFNTTTLQTEPVVSVRPTYTGGDGFTLTEWVDNGVARREDGYTKLAITKEAVGLSHVANRAFEDYRYEDFGTEMKNHFTTEFGKKLDVVEWDKKFNDWSEPNGTTVQKVFTELRDKDASILDTIRTSHQFLGFFEDDTDLKNTYAATQFTLGSLAYINSTKSYWRVRPTNVNKLVEGEPTAKDIYEDAKLKDSFRVANRDTGLVYQWNHSTKSFEPHAEITLHWVDAVVANEEDISKYLASHAKEHFFVGFLLGCRETGKIQRYDGENWEEAGDMYYEWADAYILTFAWNTFVETDPDMLKPDGIPSVGVSGKWVNSDHVHPTDETRLAKVIFDETNVKVTSEHTGLPTDFVTPKFVGGGEKVVNVPYVRKAQGVHNWQGSPTIFADTDINQIYLWSGTASQFQEDKDSIKDDSIIFVEDNEDFVTSNIVTEDETLRQGLLIRDDSKDRIVTVDEPDVDSLVGVPLTLEKVHDDINGRDAYRLKKIDLGIEPSQLVVTSVLDVGHTTITTSPSMNHKNQFVKIDDKGLVSFDTNTAGNYLKTGRDSSVNLLTDRLVMSTGENNIVKNWDSGDTEGRVVVSNGLGGIELQLFEYPGSVLFANSNNVIEETTIHHDNLIISGNELTESGDLKVETLGRHQLVITSQTHDNVVESFDTGTIADKLIVTDGLNAIKVSTFAADKLLITNGTGSVKTFNMTADDAGKLVAVGLDGVPVLIDSPTNEAWEITVDRTGENKWTASDSDNLKYGQYYYKISGEQNKLGNKAIVKTYIYKNGESIEVYDSPHISDTGDITIYTDNQYTTMRIVIR